MYYDVQRSLWLISQKSLTRECRSRPAAVWMLGIKVRLKERGVQNFGSITVTSYCSKVATLGTSFCIRFFSLERERSTLLQYFLPLLDPVRRSVRDTQRAKINKQARDRPSAAQWAGVPLRECAEDPLKSCTVFVRPLCLLLIVLLIHCFL